MQRTILKYPHSANNPCDPSMVIEYIGYCGGTYYTYRIQAFSNTEGNREFARLLSAHRGLHSEPVSVHKALTANTILLTSIMKDAIAEYCDWYLFAQQQQIDLAENAARDLSSEEMNYFLGA